MLGQFADHAEHLAELFADVRRTRARREEIDRGTMLRLTGTLASYADAVQTCLAAPRRASRHLSSNVARSISVRGSLIQGEESTRTLPFSLVAKSISFLMQRVPVRIWTMERRQRQLLSVQVLRSILEKMVLCKPPSPWPVEEHVSFAFVDQTYRQQGMLSNRQRVEYISHDNLPLRIEREVVHGL